MDAAGAEHMIVEKIRQGASQHFARNHRHSSVINNNIAQQVRNSFRAINAP